jgi:hypothetical protein
MQLLKILRYVVVERVGQGEPCRTESYKAACFAGDLPVTAVGSGWIALGGGKNEAQVIVYWDSDTPTFVGYSEPKSFNGNPLTRYVSSGQLGQRETDEIIVRAGEFLLAHKHQGSFGDGVQVENCAHAGSFSAEVTDPDVDPYSLGVRARTPGDPEVDDEDYLTI